MKNIYAMRGLRLALPIGLIMTGEMLIFLGYILAAAIIFGFDIIIIALLSIDGRYKIFQALMLVAVLQMIVIAMPRSFSAAVYNYLLIYSLMLIPIYLTYKWSKFSTNDLGFTIKWIQLYLPLGIVMGVILGGIEYLVSFPIMPLSDNPANIQKLSLLLALLAGFEEEFIFRSALQTSLEGELGLREGLFVASVVFGLTYSGYRMAEEIIFGIFAGVVLGILFQRTRSLPLIVLAHGIATITLFILNYTLHGNLPRLIPALLGHA